jgi:predicted TPR repeat methyltransferase
VRDVNRNQRIRQSHLTRKALKQASKLAANCSLERNKKTLSQAGDLLATNRAWKEAYACYVRLSELLPDDTELLQKQAYVLANSGKDQAAFQCYYRILELEPNNHTCRKNICVLMFTTGYLNDALQMADEMNASLPDDPETYYLLGEIHAERNDDALSLHFYQQAVSQYHAKFQHHEPDASTLIKVSRCLLATNSYDKAYICLKEALKLVPDMPAAHYQMGQLMENIEQSSNAIKAYRHCLKLEPDHAESLRAYSDIMAKKGRLDKSAWAYRRLLLQAPDDASLKHMLKATMKGDVKGGAEKQYVKDVFDGYARNFDDHLVNTLCYRVPEKLENLFKTYSIESKQLNTIDLGCGTGLCGPLFRSCSRKLSGVDLSACMLQQAAERGCYDDLLNCDLVEGLRSYYNCLDLVIAADVFIYVGELSEVFTGCFKALKPEGSLLFSVELTDHPKGVQLQPSGRYQHSLKYLEAQLEAHHFDLLQFEKTDLRSEDGIAVKGMLCLACKNEFSPLEWSGK